MSDIVLLAGGDGETARLNTNQEWNIGTPQQIEKGESGQAGFGGLTADGSTIFITISVSDSSSDRSDTAPVSTIAIRSNDWVSAAAINTSSFSSTPKESYPWIIECSDTDNPEYSRKVLIGKTQNNLPVIVSLDRDNLYLKSILIRKITGVSGNEATIQEIDSQITNKVKDFARDGEPFEASDLPDDLPISILQQTDIDKIEGSADADTLTYDSTDKSINISDNEQRPRKQVLPFLTQSEVDQRIADSANEHGSTGSGTTSQAKIDARVRSDDNAATGTQRGNIELATSDETIQGTNQNKAVTPKAAKDARDNSLSELLTFETALKETTVLVTNEAVTQAVSGASQAFSGRPKLPANEFDRRLYGTINGSLAFGIFIKDLENKGGVNTEGAQLNSSNSLQIRNIELAENYFISYLTSDRTLLFASDTTDTYRVTVAESSVDLENFSRRSDAALVPQNKLGTGSDGQGNKVLHDDQTYKLAAAGMSVKDEGNPLGSSGTVDTLNFTGNAITATRSGNEVSVDVQASSGGSTRTGFIQKKSPSADVQVSSVNGVWSDWTDLITATAITATQAGQVLILVDTHVDSVGSPSGGGDRIISDARLVRTRNSVDTDFHDKEIYGPRNLQGGNANTSSGFQDATTHADFFFAVADDALEGDVYKVQVRIIAQKPNETQSAMFTTPNNQLTLCSLGGSGGGGSRGLTTSQVNALIANYAKATPSGRMNEDQLPKKLDDLLDAINSAGWDDLETSRVSTPKSTSFAQGDFTGLVWVASRSESPARSTSYYPVRLLLADKQKATDKLLRLGVFDSEEGVEESTVNLAHVFDDSTYAYYSVRIPQVGEAEVVKVQEYESFEVNTRRLNTLPVEAASSDNQYINRKYQWVDIHPNLTGRLLQDGSGVGFSPTGSTSGRTPLTGFTNPFDLDTETGSGIIEVESRVSISTGKTTTLGIGVDHASSIRLINIVSNSSLRSSTAYSGSTDNGVQIGSFDIYRGNTRVQTNRLMIAKDGNNQVGLYWSWTRLAAFTALGFSNQVEALYLPMDSVDTSMFITSAQATSIANARAIAQIQSSANEANTQRRGTVRLATQAQATAGTVGDRVMTPVRVKQYVDAQGFTTTASTIKLWGQLTGSSTGVTINESSGGFTATRRAAGEYVITFSTARTNALYAVVATTNEKRTIASTNNQAAGSFRLERWSAQGFSNADGVVSFALLDLT